MIAGTRQGGDLIRDFCTSRMKIGKQKRMPEEPKKTFAAKQERTTFPFARGILLLPDCRGVRASSMNSLGSAWTPATG